MSTDIVPAEMAKSATRCGFGELAEQINEAHRLAREHAESAIDHAFRAGALLLKAKAQVPHGRWLPWLRENVKFSERSAQAYMRLAAKQESIRSNIADAEDGISVRQALEHLRRPLRAEYQEEDRAEETEEEGSAEAKHLLHDVFGGDVWALGTHLLERPFCSFDIEGEDWVRHFSNKLLYQAKVGGVIGALLVMLWEYDPIPLLRVAPADQLIEALQRLEPLASGKGRSFPMEVGRLRDAKTIIGCVEIIACWFVGALLNEIDHRHEIDDETYAHEFEEVDRRFKATSQARLHALHGVRERHEQGEFADVDAYIAALKEAERCLAVA